MKTLLSLIIGFMLVSCSSEKAGPYDGSMDATAAIENALNHVKSENKLALLEFGANWCSDCISLDKTMAKSPLKELIDEHFTRVKVDIGDGDNNMDLVDRYGGAARRGIPTIVVLDENNNILTATLTGQLASARKMGERELFRFFEKLIADTKDRS